MRRRTTLFLALGFSVLVAPSRMVQEPRDPADADRNALEVFNSVVSPFCPVRLLANCPSAQAGHLQAEMRQKLRDGVPGPLLSTFRSLT